MGRIYRPSLDRRPSDEYPMPPCTKVDPDIFFQHRNLLLAQQICHACPFRRSCRDMVLACDTDPGGVYAGHTEASRDKIRETLRYQRAGS